MAVPTNNYLRTVLEVFSFGRDALILHDHLCWLSWAVPNNLRTVQEKMKRRSGSLGLVVCYERLVA